MSNMDEETKCDLLKRFPKVEPSNERVVHYKVLQADIFLVIPDGKKCFIWFLVYKNQNVCVLMEISNDGNSIINIWFLSLLFHQSLSYNTIFYGTLIEGFNGEKNITIEDVFYFKGKNISNVSFNKKIEILTSFFENDFQQLYVNKNSAYIGLSPMSSNYDDLLKLIEDKKINYKIKFINYRFSTIPKKSLHTFYHKNTKQLPTPTLTPTPPQAQQYTNISQFHSNKNKQQTHIPTQKTTQLTQSTTQQQKLFTCKVKATNYSDIYQLFVFDEKQNSFVFYNNAFIPDYKTSIMMNKLFNDKFELYDEFNDDNYIETTEEEQTTNDKSFNEKIIKCYYNNKFKKFIPYSVITNPSPNEKITTLNQLSKF